MGNLKKFVTYLLVICLVLPITPGNPVAAASIKLSSTLITLNVGKTKTIKLKGTKKTPKWSSSNKNVATVSSKGKIKAKKKGNAVITAKLGKKKYKCKVKVKAVVPTAKSTGTPSIAPIVKPTNEPTTVPTAEPTIEPTVAPTAEPTIEPTVAPTVTPTIAPTAEPTATPTIAPTAGPTSSPVADNYQKLSDHIKKNGKYDSDDKLYYIDDMLFLDGGDLYVQIRYNLDGSLEFCVMMTISTTYGKASNLVTLTITPPDYSKGAVAEIFVSDTGGLLYADGTVNLSSLSKTNSNITYTSTNATTASEKNSLYELGESYLALGLPSWSLLLKSSGSDLTLKDLGFTSYDI